MDWEKRNHDFAIIVVYTTTVVAIFGAIWAITSILHMGAWIK